LVKKISILDFNLSNNSLGRAYILGQALSRHYDVEIIGPAVKGHIWEPLRQCEIRIRKVPYHGFPLLLFSLPSIMRAIDGDVIYAVKPRLTSFGFALLKKFFSNTPLVLDIDDWEPGFYLKKGVINHALSSMNIVSPNSFFWTWLMNRFIRRADGITTVSNFLRERYGGEIIPHAKDTDRLDPDRFRGNPVTLPWTEGKKTVMFLGTPRKHKGLEDALDAVLSIEEPEVVLVVAGGKPEDTYMQKLKKRGGERFIPLGNIPLSEVPAYLKAADVVVVPQKRSTATSGQIPSKIFDAMSMAKPVISTEVSDIPDILEGCGIIVKPDSPEELRKAIRWVLENPEQGALMGAKARKKCIELYSLQSIDKRLKDIVEGVAQGNRP
jgi:glycosyltransferase involved in cell wall biosynthesis